MNRFSLLFPHRMGLFALYSLLYLLAGSCNPAKPAPGCIDPSKIRKDAVCPMIYQPVCGCDGKTYGNSCEAEVAGVTRWTEGPCPAKKGKSQP